MKTGIKVQLILFVFLVIILGTAALGTYSVMTAKNEVIQSAQQKLISDLALGKEIINKTYPGDWRLEGDQLYKGKALLNNNFAIVDRIGKLTNDTVTIFRKDTRVTTNVRNDKGERAVGTQVSPQVATTVLDKGKTYLGEAVVVGTPSQTAYQPIKDKDGKVIGIWYVGVPNAPYEELAKHHEKNIILFGVVELLIFSIISWLLVNWKVKPLVKLTEAAARIAEGDLRVEIEQASSKDEIGQLTRSVGQMVFNLRKLLNSINEQIYLSTEQIAVGTEETAHAVEKMTQTFSEVSESSQILAEESVRGKTAILESSTVLLELSSLIQIANSKAGIASNGSKISLESAKKGMETVAETISRMETIHEKTNETNAIMEQLKDYSRQINVMAQTITEIAQQTNLLSLNAAIEAARAGEYGKGFAVVADEVRKLSDQSNRGAEQVASIIEKVLNSIDSINHSITESQTEVNLGVQAAKNSGHALENILALVRESVEAIDNIRVVTSEEVATSDRIIELINQVSSIVEHSAATSEDVSKLIQEINIELQTIAAGSEEISAMASDLKLSLKSFSL